MGSRLVNWDFDGSGPALTFQSIEVAGSGATNPDPTPSPVPPLGTAWGPLPHHVIVPDADGWIAVDPLALDNGFQGSLLRVDSQTAVPGGAAPGSGAGVTPAAPKNGTALLDHFRGWPDWRWRNIHQHTDEDDGQQLG